MEERSGAVGAGLSGKSAMERGSAGGAERATRGRIKDYGCLKQERELMTSPPISPSSPVWCALAASVLVTA